MVSIFEGQVTYQYLMVGGCFQKNIAFPPFIMEVLVCFKLHASYLTAASSLGCHSYSSTECQEDKTYISGRSSIA